MEPRWEWVDTMFGVITGLIAGVLSLFSWVNNRLQAVHRRIDKASDATVAQAVDIAKLQAQDDANMHFQSRIDRSLENLILKTDDILFELKKNGQKGGCTDGRCD